MKHDHMGRPRLSETESTLKRPASLLEGEVSSRASVIV